MIDLWSSHSDGKHHSAFVVLVKKKRKDKNTCQGIKWNWRTNKMSYPVKILQEDYMNMSNQIYQMKQSAEWRLGAR